MSSTARVGDALNVPVFSPALDITRGDLDSQAVKPSTLLTTAPVYVSSKHQWTAIVRAR